MLQQSSNSMRSPASQAISARRRNRRLGLALLIAGALCALAIAAIAWFALRPPAAKKHPIRFDISAPPASLRDLNENIMPLAPEKAAEVNAAIAVSTAPLEPGRPFVLPIVTAENIVSYQTAVDCLTAAIYYEAASESEMGQRAVAQVVLNRMRHPAFPKSVCGVVYEGAERRTGCQFSFTCDGSLARTPSQVGWARARRIALAALSGYVERSVGTATHYHTVWVVPYWAYSLDKITTLGAHIFYRWKGYWGQRAAFTGSYVGEDVKNKPEMDLFAGIAAEDVTSEGNDVPAITGPRPIADDIGKLTVGSALAATPSVEAPRADQERGILVADEKTGTLVGTQPKGN